MRAFVFLAFCLVVAIPASAGSVSSQSNPEAARIFEKTEFDAVVRWVNVKKGFVVVKDDEGIEHRLKFKREHLTSLKHQDKVRVHLRGDGKDKEAYKIVKI